LRLVALVAAHHALLGLFAQRPVQGAVHGSPALGTVLHIRSHGAALLATLGFTIFYVIGHHVTLCMLLRSCQHVHSHRDWKHLSRMQCGWSLKQWQSVFLTAALLTQSLIVHGSQ